MKCRGCAPSVCEPCRAACSSTPKTRIAGGRSFTRRIDAGIEALGVPSATSRSAACPQCVTNLPIRATASSSGSTTPLYGTEVYPPNLTPDPDTGLGTWSDDDIARAIRDGFAPGLQPLCLQMSRFDRMSDDEVLAIIAYLRHLPAVKRKIPVSICPPIKPDRD